MKKTCIFVSVSVALITAVMCFAYIKLGLSIAYCEEQCDIFRQCAMSQTKSAEDIDGRISYIREYYPSGTKQATDSKLDAITETCRSLAIELLEAKKQLGMEKRWTNGPVRFNK
jgi:hypothetical protein